MIRFEKLFTEKVYPFENAKVDGNYKNGTLGTVTDGTFTAGAGFKAIMQVEKGDNMNTVDFKVLNGEDARIVDFAKADGQIVNITSDMYTGAVVVGDMLKANATGVLAVDSGATSECFEVIEVVRYGVRAIVVA